MWNLEFMGRKNHENQDPQCGKRRFSADSATLARERLQNRI